MQIVKSQGFFPYETCYSVHHGKRQGLSIQDNDIDIPSMAWYFEDKHQGPSIHQIAQSGECDLDFHDSRKTIMVIPYKFTDDVYQKVARYPHPIPEARILARSVWYMRSPVYDVHPWNSRDQLIIFLVLEFGLIFSVLESMVYAWGDYDQSPENYRKFLIEKGYLSSPQEGFIS